MLKKISYTFLTFRDRLITLTPQQFMRFVLFFPGLATLGCTIIILYFYSQLPPEIPLYYSRPWGADQLSQPIFLFTLPLGNFLWYILSLYFIATIMHEYRVFAQMVIVVSAIVSLLTIVSVANILLLVM